MRRLPHLVQALTPSRVTDGYGDEIDGPLVADGDPFPGWLQARDVVENGGVVTRVRTLYTRPSAPLLGPSSAVEVNGDRYEVDGDAIESTRPSGRSEFRTYRVKRVTRGE